MEQVYLNARERSRAFWKFLLFFTVAVLSVVLAVFLYWQVPKKENVYLKGVTADYKAHMTEEQKFTALIEEANGKLDSLGTTGDPNFLNGQIGNTLGKIDASTLDDKADKLFLSIMLKYYDAKKRLVDLKDVAAKNEQLTNDKAQLQNDLNQTKMALQLCQSRGN